MASGSVARVTPPGRKAWQKGLPGHMASGWIKVVCIDARTVGGAAASLSRSAERRFAASPPGPGTASANNNRFWAPLFRASVVSGSVGARSGAGPDSRRHRACRLRS